MFKLVRIAVVIGALAYFSPLRSGGDTGAVAVAGVDGLTRLLTAAWSGGDLKRLPDAKALQDMAVSAGLRRTLDPAVRD